MRRRFARRTLSLARLRPPQPLPDTLPARQGVARSLRARRGRCGRGCDAGGLPVVLMRKGIALFRTCSHHATRLLARALLSLPHIFVLR